MCKRLVCKNLKFLYSRLLTSVTELSQLFPTLDDDLCSVGTHFTFDHLTQSSNTINKTHQIPSASIQSSEVHEHTLAIGADTQNEMVSSYNYCRKIVILSF